MRGWLVFLVEAPFLSTDKALRIEWTLYGGSERSDLYEGVTLFGRVCHLQTIQNIVVLADRKMILISHRRHCVLVKGLMILI